MGLNLRVLKFLCDRFVISKLISVKVQGEVMYFTKKDYERLSQSTHKDSFLFELSSIKIGDKVLDLFLKFYLRPSKKVYKDIVTYCKEELDKEMLMVIFHNDILVVMESLKTQTSSLLGSILKR